MWAPLGVSCLRKRLTHIIQYISTYHGTWLAMAIRRPTYLWRSEACRTHNHTHCTFCAPGHSDTASTLTAAHRLLLSIKAEERKCRTPGVRPRVSGFHVVVVSRQVKGWACGKVHLTFDAVNVCAATAPRFGRAASPIMFIISAFSCTNAADAQCEPCGNFACSALF